MATIEIADDELSVHVHGLDPLWTLQSHLTIPLAHVRGATADPGILTESKGRRGPGTHVPSVVVAGTFHHDGDRVFWDVHDKDKAIVIELQDETYRRLIIEVEEPRVAVELIETALTAR